MHLHRKQHTSTTIELSIVQGCGYAVENEMAKLDSRVFHVECFVCHNCKLSLVGKQVHIEGGKNYDQDCFISVGSNRCDICDQPILGDNETYIKSKGMTYHVMCYVCSQCGNSLRKKRYQVDGRKRICQHCMVANRVSSAPSSEAAIGEVCASDMSEEL